MWSGQDDNYDAFVKWVSEQQPDICIWCEAQSIFLSGTADRMPNKDRYLVDGWGELAARYGHQYCYTGGHRDSYPQVITSKYPIENIERIVGTEPDSVVTHGAGWARIKVNGHMLNLVSLHLWPQRFAYGAEDKDASIAGNGGDHYRRMEMEYICKHTIGTVSASADQMWFMAGDFNARSRHDNWFYKYPENDTRLLVHDYIKQNTPYLDIIADKYPGEFKTTTHGKARIDFVYCTVPLYDRIVLANVLLDEYTTPVRDSKGLSNFWHPSDHLPIMVEFDMGKK
jgi:endonuclease/exonuclease/phosphatase family metal-dependent hydrolase